MYPIRNAIKVWVSFHPMQTTSRLEFAATLKEQRAAYGSKALRKGLLGFAKRNS